jgi:hypothetical protein
MKMVDSKSPQTAYPLVKLPHPFLTSYRVCSVGESEPAKLTLVLEDQPAKGRSPPEPLHSLSLTWRDLTSRRKEECPPLSDNSAYARAFRAPHTTFEWDGSSPATLGQIWNAVHAIYLAQPTIEYFRLSLVGTRQEVVRNELLYTGLAIEHPAPWFPNEKTPISSNELLILRSSFWQGAASPTGPRPIWITGDHTDDNLRKHLDQYPIMPEIQHFTMKLPQQNVYARHPVRRPKPCPGSICYSRYIPEVDDHFSLEVVDWQNDEHLKLFNKWQNSPRVAAGWNETGTLDQHREYLKNLHFDPHVLCLFGRFDDTRFSYYELYWSKVYPMK